MPRSRTLRRPHDLFSSRRARDTESFEMQQPRLHAASKTPALLKVGEWTPPKRGVGEAWQADAYGYARTIGELGYVLNLTANTVADCKLIPVEHDDDMDEWVPTDDERVRRVMKAFVGPKGGTAELMRRAALHMQIAGETYLIGTDDDAGGILWEFLSTQEIKVETGGKVRRNSSGRAADRDFVPVDVYIARVYRPDAEFSDLADSPVKRNLAVCKEVVVLTQVVDAIAKSRLAAGILFVPEEMSFASEDESDTDDDDTDDIDKFTEDLLEHLSAPVEDRTSAASLVPLILRGAVDHGDKVKLIEIARDLDKLYTDLRQEAIGRLGGGLDIPPEIMSGKGGLNHWTGYNVDADFVRKHVSPLGGFLVDEIVNNYMRPMLIEFEGMSDEEADRFALEFDTSPVSTRLDAGPAARSAFILKAVSGETFRRENGFDESDAPDEEELMQRDLRDLLMKRPVEYAWVLPLLYPQLEGQMPEAPMPEPDGDTTPEGDDEREDPENEPPDNDTGQDEPAPPDEDGDGEAPVPDGDAAERALVDRLAVAADAALERALERACARVVPKINANKDLTDEQERLRAAEKVDALNAVGADGLAAVGVTQQSLFSGSWDQFADKARGFVRQHLINADVPHFLADDEAEAVTRALVELVEEHAMSSVHRPLRVGENGLRVPDQLIRMALSSAQGVRI